MSQDRVADCKAYILGTVGPMLLNEAQLCFRQWYDDLSTAKKKVYHDRIALPGKKKSKNWRDALRSVLLLELILDDNDDTQRQADVVVKAKKEYGDWSEPQLQGAIRTGLMTYTKKVNQLAITALRDAANHVLLNYGAVMDSSYRTALNDVFIDNNVKAGNFLYSMRWHRTMASWMARVREIALRYASTGGKDGSTEAAMTLPWGNVPNAYVDIVSNTAPYDRVIEFRDPNDTHSLIHEMLHWSTHKTYQDAVGNLNGGHGNERRFVHEGATEWLKRNLTGLWAQGGYSDIFDSFNDFVIKAGKVDPGDLQRAYFGGTNQANVIAALRQVFKGKETDIFMRGLKGKDLSKVLSGAM